MMTIEQFWLAKLAEECTEVGQRALKQMQFGRDQVWKGGEVSGGVAPESGIGLSNAERLRSELNDLISIVNQLERMDEIPYTSLHKFVQLDNAKREKIQKYLKLSQDLGLVEKA